MLKSWLSVPNRDGTTSIKGRSRARLTTRRGFVQNIKVDALVLGIE